MRPGYDLSCGVRGTHYEHFRRGTNVVVRDAPPKPPAPPPLNPPNIGRVTAPENLKGRPKNPAKLQ
jgi:hypothetical protein